MQFFFKTFSKLLGFLCTAVTLVPFFMGSTTFNALWDQLSLTQGQFVLACLVLLVIILGVCLFQHSKDARKAETCGIGFNNFHEKLIAAIFEMRKKNAEPLEYSTHTAFYEFAKLRCHELCEDLSKFLKYKYNKEFSVCIKMIDKRSINKVKRTGNLGDAEVYTFCRAGCSQDTREKNEKGRAAYNTQEKRPFCVPVRDNSDFFAILSDDQDNKATTRFACSNLRMNERLSEILGRPKYRNSTPKYWKYYKSTVVVPIQVEKKYVDPKEDESLTGRYQTVGFLCIDYKKPISTAILNELAGYIQGFGESLYPLFHEIGITDRRIAQVESKNEYARGGVDC